VHTPAHVVVNVAIATGWISPEYALPVLMGAAIPDLPIVVLYIRERYFRGLPDEQIWRESYQQRFWQDLIHGAHSIPLTTSGMLVALFAGASGIAAFFGSMLFHALVDLPLHNEDAHRHFLPFSHYRFISPVSYWDVRYHARTIVIIEALVTTFAAYILWTCTSYMPARAALIAVVAWYVFKCSRYWRQ
jgi:hypothetical protein